MAQFNPEIDGGLNYANGTKRTWRGTVWNRVGEMMGSGVVLYLPGQDDLDRPFAFKHGIDMLDLIAVERDRRVVKSLRRQKCNVVEAPLHLVLDSWPKDTMKIGAVIADLQCGFTSSPADILLSYGLHPSLNNAVLVFNLQRGRDPGPLLKMLKSALKGKNILDVNREFIDDRLLLPRDRDTSLHRGWLIAGAYFSMCLEFKLHHKRQPKLILLPSYRSTANGPLMDSIIIQAEFQRSLLRETWVNQPCSQSDVAGKITAALAVRTRRLRDRDKKGRT